MFLVVWEFKIKPDCLEKFLRVYGPEGDWAQLFANDCNFQKTVLVQEAGSELVFLTMDFWDHQDAYLSFKQKYAQAYHDLDRECEGLTVHERHVGSFKNIAV